MENELNIKWFPTEPDGSAIKIYNNNITFSKNAANYFIGAAGVIVGIIPETKQIAIKLVTKEEVQRGIVEGVYKLDVKESYSRINSIKLINYLSKHLNLDFKKNKSYKYHARWNTGYRMLIVDTKDVEEGK